MRGTLTTWNDDRGFGFISAPGIPSNLFVHISAFAAGSARPEVGDGVTFGIGEGAKGAQAERVRLTGLQAVGKSVGRYDYLAILAFLPLVAFVLLHWAAPLIILAIYVAVSLLTFLAYRADKRAAELGTWRTPEASLLLLGVVGGWPGAIVAMRMFHHKTKKLRFRVLFWISVAMNVIALVVVTSPAFGVLLGRLFAAL